MSSNLMDIEPGGESRQYESIKTVTEPHDKSSGQLSGGTTSDLTDAEAQEAREKGERGEKTAANIRYGQAISEQGMGGETKGLGGVGGQQDGDGQVKADDDDIDAKQSRKAQGYGHGSGVGA